jgi:peptidoglycan/xylan/chitin deacetylase (PgdA/CDA1 family)
MRIDRLLTLAFFYPAIKLLCRNSGQRIPILMYHGISKQLDDHLHPYFRTVTSPERFEQQMRFLSENGYEVLTLSEALRLMQKRPVSSNSNKETPVSFDKQRPIVVITFDDGLRDFYGAAFPVLEKFGFKATVFLTSGLIDKTFPTGSECLRETEIKELAAKGIEFGSHTESHPQLKKLPEDKILHELSASKITIEAIIRSPVTLFSYPYKFPEEDRCFTKNLAALLVKLGYSSEVTTIIGTVKPSDNPFFLKRLPINDCDDMRFFHAKLAGAYNWLHIGQLAYKRFKRSLRG